MNNGMDDVQARLQALRESYAKQLPDKMTAIQTHWHLLQATWDWQTLEQLHRLIHSIAGSGGSFGFHVLGNQAREIEIELKHWRKEKIYPGPEQQAAIGQKLAQLAKTAAA